MLLKRLLTLVKHTHIEVEKTAVKSTHQRFSLLQLLSMFHHEPTVFSIDIRAVSISKLSDVYHTVLLKKNEGSNHIWFNKMCLKKNFVPKYVEVAFKHRTFECQSVVKETYRFWLTSEIKK